MSKEYAMSVKFYPAADRGHFDFGWLDTNHTFSFGHYYHPDRTRFGMLRVFNDDVVAPGEGFGTHPHNDMEIISIPLEGTIVHRDSMKHDEALRPGDVQVMSAGTGLTHSEFNGSSTEYLKFLQIWIIPNKPGVEPRYDQRSFTLQPDHITTVAGPKNGSAPLWINQDAWLSLVKLTAGRDVTYTSHREGNGLFVFQIEGTSDVNGHVIGRRDAIGFEEAGTITISADTDSYAVIIDVPR
ncbi:MAG: pirin family protein [Ignavibacteriae bacterium]|nr:MAG: pirin family protein [Ignavibacteriota bacterium]